VAFYDEEEDEGGQENLAGGVPKGQVSTVVGAGAPGGAGTGTGATKKPDSSGNFVGISQYLDANKQQAQKLGQQTSGLIDTAASEARNQLGQLQSEASQNIRAVDSLGDDLKGRVSGAAETLSDQERQRIKDTASAQYTGPKAVTDLANYQTAAQAAKTAQERAQMAQTEEGRMGLISKVNEGPRTQGMNVFDQALLQAGGGREMVEQAAQRTQDIPSALNQTKEQIQQQIGGATQQTQQAQADAFETIQNALRSWQEQFNPRVQEAQNALVQEQQRLMTDIGQNPYELDNETMAALGLRAGDRLFGTDLNQFINQASPSDITAANVATTDDYARYAALADLAGDQSNFLDQANIGMAGTAPRSVVDQEGLRNTLNQANQDFWNKAQGISARAGGGMLPTVSANLADYLKSGGVNLAFHDGFGLSKRNEAALKAYIEQQFQKELANLGYNTAVNVDAATKRVTPNFQRG